MPFLLYALVTWTTRDRGPLITVQVEAFLRKTLPQIAHRHGAAVLAMGIVDDHVHLLVRLPARFDVPRLAQGLKGTTARLANRDRIAEQATPLQWASGYDLRSVGPRELRAAKEYLQSQPSRHPDRVPRGVAAL